MRGPGEETLDELLKGRLKIYQKKSGFRYSIDALLLAHFARQAIEGMGRGDLRVVDLGSGTGVISLVLGLCDAVERVAGLEIEMPMVEMSRRSAALNGLEERIVILQGDIRNPPVELGREAFDMAVCNPPYRRLGEGRLNPNRQKAIARHEITVELADILKAADRLLAPRGVACFIYGAFRLTDIIVGLRKVNIEPISIRFVHSMAGEEAKMALICAQKSGHKRLDIHPPLFIYRDRERHTEEAAGIIEGNYCVSAT